jgi:Zn-dependent protease
MEIFNNPQLLKAVALYYVVTIVSLALHELGHAASAVALGDETPREQGRLTLNPIVHLDLLGSVLVPLTMLILMPMHAPIAWAKPVEISGYRFTRKIRLKTGVMATAAAGPAVNFALAVGAAFALAFWEGRAFPGGPLAHDFAARMLELNVLLFLFNLLPVPPLDGSRVLKGILPNAAQGPYTKMERFSPVFLGLLFLSGAGAMLHQPLGWLTKSLLAVARDILS